MEGRAKEEGGGDDLQVRVRVSQPPAKTGLQVRQVIIELVSCTVTLATFSSSSSAQFQRIVLFVLCYRGVAKRKKAQREERDVQEVGGGG